MTRQLRLHRIIGHNFVDWTFAFLTVSRSIPVTQLSKVFWLAITKYCGNEPLLSSN